MRLSACRNLSIRPVAATWYRAIQLRFWNSLLAAARTSTVPGRFNVGSVARPGFEILYFAEDQQVAMFEVQALLGSPYPPATYAPNPNASWAVTNIDVQLARVADLTRVSERKKLGTTVQELTGDWRGYLLRNPHPSLAGPYWSNVPTQRLGHAPHGVSSLEGFLTYSAKEPTRKNLIVFPRKLHPGSSIRFRDPISGDALTLP